MKYGDPNFGSALRDHFIRMACELNSVDNYVPAELYFFSIMGAWLKNARINKGGSAKDDLRVSTVWIQDSRTGKGVLNKVTEKVCKGIGLSVVTTTEVTTAGLIGTIDSEAVKFNSQYGLTAENPAKEVGGGSKRKFVAYQDPVIKGDLGNFEVIIIDEGKTLLQPTTHTEQLLSVLQPVLDCPGWVRKKLASKFPVEYQASPTLLISSIKLDNMSKILMEQGFFQRVALFIRDISIEERKEMQEKQLENQKFEIVPEYESIMNEFVAMVKQIPRQETFLSVTDEAKNMLRDIRKQYYDKISAELKGSELTSAGSLGETIQQLCLKIAGQYAIMGGSNVIQQKNIIQARKIVVNLVHTIIEELEIKEESKHLGYAMRIVDFLKPYSGKLSRTDARDLVAVQFKIGQNKALKEIAKLVKANYLSVDRKEHNKQLLIVNAN